MVTSDQRISRLEGAYEQVDKRLDDMHQSIESLRAEMNTRFNTHIVLVGGSWATLMAAIIGLYLVR